MFRRKKEWRTKWCIFSAAASGSVSTADEFYITNGSRIKGTGSIVIGLGGEMIIDSNAVVDLNDPGGDPNVKGTIQCNGLLKVKGNGQLKHATVNVSRQAGGYFGKFEIEDSAKATNLDIHTDGDRFMDVDPCTFTGTIANNRIYVTITEGQNQTQEGILEVRGVNLTSPPCDFNDPNVLACQISSGTMPAFDTTSWTLERLEVAAGAKVTLVDRFSSGNGDPEVLYVKDINLGAGCVLNVGSKRLYYTNLSGDPNLIKKEAMLGSSLGEINSDSNEEFQRRVSNNNYIDPADPNSSRVYIERVVGLEPDPNGMILMRNLEDMNGQMIFARAKGEFAPAVEEEIRIRFNYLFNTSDPNAQIVVYLSDMPELQEPRDPSHYIEVGRVLNPPWPRPGSADSNLFGNFDALVSTGGLDLSMGTWIELELVEPASGGGGLFALGYGKGMQLMDSGGYGASGYTDDWAAGISCQSSCMTWDVCRDLVWDDCLVLVSDFLKVVTGTGTGNSPTCVDGAFSADGYTDSYDTVSWDWMLKTDTYPCGQVPLSSGAKGFAASGFGAFGGAVELLDLSVLNDLLISGKRNSTDDETKMKDRLYIFDSSYHYIEPIGLEPDDRCNIRIVRGVNNNFYQINSKDGVLELETRTQIVPPGQVPYDGNEPRYNLPATVYAGIYGTVNNPYGRPIIDAAFDANANCVYVVPVVVVPYGNEANTYTAAAKLQLNPSYKVVKLYDGPILLPYDNQLQYRNNLREIELDGAGNVYVTNANTHNACDILWMFEPNGAVLHRLDLDLNNPIVRAPTGMCVSSVTNVLYLASSLRNEADPNSAVIHGFSTKDLNLVRTITVRGMHHITSITEDPNSKSLWVTGFNLNSNPAPMPYDPYIAKVPFRINDVNALYISDADDLAMPLSICWTGALPPPVKCGGADLNKNGTVNMRDLAVLAKYWLRTDCFAFSNCEGADLEPQGYWDGDVDLFDLDTLADYWLNTNCQ